MPHEGTIKFRVFHTKHRPHFKENISQLIFLRQELVNRGLLGVYPKDHEVFPSIGYGNVSMRLREKEFVITGSQTGHLKHITADEMVRVTNWSIAENLIHSIGLLKPSSEALTHAAIYECDENVRFVAHIHSALLWESSEVAGLDVTPESAEYGSPGLAFSVKKLCIDNSEPRVVVMKGHKEGILTWGNSPMQILGLPDSAFERLSKNA